ncbi:MAG: type II toxin-antitoxin system VapC family toxin [Acidimicrobiia bacterium]
MRLLDTTVAVDHLRGNPAAVAFLESLLATDEDEGLLASEVTRFELLAGVRPRERTALEDFFTVLEWVPVTEAVAREAGDLARRYRRSHSGTGAADFLIAATSSLLDAELLTTNVRHFPMFPKLAPPY